MQKLNKQTRSRQFRRILPYAGPFTPRKTPLPPIKKFTSLERLARQRRLPYVLLPDGSMRFDWDEIERLVLRIPSGDKGVNHDE